MLPLSEVISNDKHIFFRIVGVQENDWYYDICLEGHI